MQLDGKVAIVTGGARGLGRAYAERMAAEGAAVVVGDVRDCAATIAAVEAAGGRIAGGHLDVSDLESCRNLVASALENFGAVDILVNNAALYGDISGGRFDEISDDQWDAVMRVNIKGIWNCCRAAVPAMRDAGGGSIINISSLAATYGMPFALDYAMSKGAVIAMTRSLARELGRNWIRVNAVAPSAVLTEGTTEFMGDKYEKALEVIAAGQSLKSNLTTEDLCGTIVYLASDASRFVTGQTIAVDGGTVFL